MTRGLLLYTVSWQPWAGWLLAPIVGFLTVSAFSKDALRSWKTGMAALTTMLSNGGARTIGGITTSRAGWKGWKIIVIALLTAASYFSGYGTHAWIAAHRLPPDSASVPYRASQVLDRIRNVE